MAASLRIELFVSDLTAFADFYTRVLGFEIVQDERTEPTPYLFVRRGLAAVGAVEAGRAVPPERRAVPEGVEIVLDVDDVEAEYTRVVETGWPLASGLQPQPWGLVDFRLNDPDGHYIRVTGRLQA